jgi:hypothetical protein
VLVLDQCESELCLVSLLWVVVEFLVVFVLWWCCLAFRVSWLLCLLSLVSFAWSFWGGVSWHVCKARYIRYRSRPFFSLPLHFHSSSFAFFHFTSTFEPSRSYRRNNITYPSSFIRRLLPCLHILYLFRSYITLGWGRHVARCWA